MGLLVSTGILILMSLGKNFDILNRLLFNYLPLLNKFRTPNSIHNIISCIIPLFAVYTLYQLFTQQKDKKAIIQLLIKVTAGITGFVVLFGLGGKLFFDFMAEGDARYDPNLVSVLKEARSIYMTQDSFRTLLFLLSGSVVLYLYLIDKLKKSTVIGILTVLTFIDLFGVARRYISPDDWKPKSAMKNAIPLRPVDEQILQYKQLYYRVLDQSKDPFQDATSASFHKLIGGYHPAKFRRYQDIIDAYLTSGNQKVLNMLNTKYIISQNQQSQLNPGAFGNAWLVRNIQKVSTPDEEIAAIANIDPAETAIVLDREFPNYISTNSFTKIGTIELTRYEPNALTYKAQVDGDQLAVFSEVWYGPDKGWQAYIDEKPVDHIRVNYILRGLKIPAGSHNIEIKFVPTKVIRSVQWGFWLNNIIGIVFLGILGWWFYQDYRNRKTIEPPLVPQPVPSKTLSSKPKPRKTR